MVITQELNLIYAQELSLVSIGDLNAMSWLTRKWREEWSDETIEQIEKLDCCFSVTNKWLGVLTKLNGRFNQQNYVSHVWTLQITMSFYYDYEDCKFELFNLITTATNSACEQCKKIEVQWLIDNNIDYFVRCRQLDNI